MVSDGLANGKRRIIAVGRAERQRRRADGRNKGVLLFSRRSGGTAIGGYIHYLQRHELWFRPYGGSLFPTAEKVTKKAVLLVWLLLRRNTLTPVSLRGPAPNGHPCPDGALAASMRLGPRSETCVQPAPKSRFVSSGSYVFEDQDQDQKQSNSFPAEAGPTDGCS